MRKKQLRGAGGGVHNTSQKGFLAEPHCFRVHVYHNFVNTISLQNILWRTIFALHYPLHQPSISNPKHVQPKTCATQNMLLASVCVNVCGCMSACTVTCVFVDVWLYLCARVFARGFIHKNTKRNAIISQPPQPTCTILVTQCCSCHATQVDGVLPGRSNRQQSPAGPVNMRRNMRRLQTIYSWGRQSQFWVEIGAVYNGLCKTQSGQKQKTTTALLRWLVHHDNAINNNQSYTRVQSRLHLI